MSKLMILFVLFVSGALYDPPRVLNHLGPGSRGDRLEDQDDVRCGDAESVQRRETRVTPRRVNPAGSSRLEMCPAPGSST